MAPEKHSGAAAPGISVIVCCYNSATRLPATLDHLARQQTRVDWELIVVNNASTDDTPRVARECWKNQSVPLRIVDEQRPGLIHARHAGLRASRHDCVSFVDDDNWLCPGWVETVAEILRSHPDVAACGGRCEAVFEGPAPEWFARHEQQFAVGPQGPGPGPVDKARGYLYGAGMTLRRSAIDDLTARGFRSLLAGRTGKSLSSGEDVELCMALRMRGWRLWYEPALRIQHYMPKARLQWTYLRRLHRAMGASSVWLEAYESILAGPPASWKDRIRRTWFWQWRYATQTLWICRSHLRRVEEGVLEGDEDVLKADFALGRANGLLRTALIYDAAFRSLESAAWREMP